MLSSLIFLGMVTMTTPATSEITYAASMPAVTSGYGCADGSKPWVPGAIRTRDEASPQDQTPPGPQKNPTRVQVDCALV